MSPKAQKVRLQFTENGLSEIVLTTNENRLQIQKQVAEWKQITEKGKELSVKVEQYRPKRSHDANAYMWVLLSKMADELNKDRPDKRYTKDELYIEMLERYGVFTHIVVKPNVVNKVKEEWRTVKEIGEITVNGKTGIQLQCYFGSSTYDTKEMSVLIDGVVSEAKELGIETLTPQELALLKSEWGSEKKAS